MSAHNAAIVSARHLDEWVCGGKKKAALVKQIHPHLSCNPSIWHTSAASFPAVPYLAGLSDGTSVKTSSGLGSGMGMMYSLYEVMASCVSASSNSPMLELWLYGSGGKARVTGDGEPKAGLAIGKGEESRGLVRATAGWSLFKKLSFTWLYLCCQETIV